MRTTLRTLVILIVLLVAGSPRAAARQAPPAPDRAQVLSAARDVMKQARYATLVTIAEDGQPQARVVDPADPDRDLTVWIGTNPASRKVAQLQNNSRATLLYFDRATESYVSLLGSASLVTDPTEKERHWQSRWAQHYPEGPRSASHMLIRFTPRTLEIVSGPHKLQGDPRTWRPVVLELAGQDKPDFSGRWILAAGEQSGPGIPKALSVRQSLVRTNVRGEPMEPFFKDIAVARETESGTHSETYAIGVVGGAVSGARVDGTQKGPVSHLAVRWEQQALVFESGNSTDGTSETRVRIERREVWLLEPDGRLRVTVTTRSSVDGSRTVTRLYRR